MYYDHGYEVGSMNSMYVPSDACLQVVTFWTTFYESWWGAGLNYSMLTSGFTPSEFRMY